MKKVKEGRILFNVFSDSSIMLTKGNSAIIEITPIDAETETPIILTDGDKILFSVKTTIGPIVLQKILTKDDYLEEGDTYVSCVITPEETINLSSGEYKYDCLLYRNDGTVSTFISSRIKLLNPVGTYRDIGDGNG